MKKKHVNPARGKCIWLRKLLTIMKLTFFLLLTSTMLVSAVGYSQSTRLNLDYKKISVGQLFQLIEDQTDYRFAYSKSSINPDEEVTIDVKDATLDQVLKIILDNEQLMYNIIDRYVVISDKPTSSQTGQQQQKTVSGKVTDTSGQPLPGVTVVVKGTTNGTITDFDGKYTLASVPGDATLVFSFVGMRSQENSASGKTTVNVQLEEETIGIEEVVAVGYGTQKKINLTGSVDVVSGEVLTNRSAPNVSSLIQGTSPNLNISMTNLGGEPGAASSWNIRGIGSIAGNSSPLILIDGVESNINNIDPESIESISVLKDASASAIYGSRAPFGVILLTTKKGKKNESIRISYNNNLSFASPLNIPHFVDALTWVTSYNQVQANSGLAPVFPAEQVERIKGYMAGTYKTEYNPDKPPTSIWRGRWDGNANYDWPAEYYKKSSFSQKHTINLEGGGENTQYFVSSGYYDQGGLYSWGDDLYKRYNVMANITSQITNWLRFDYSSKYARTEIDHPLGIVGQPRSYIFRSFLSFSPMMPKYNIDGSICNPLIRALQSSGRENIQNNDLGITLRTEIEPVKGWKTNMSYNYNYGGSSNIQNPKPVLVQNPNGTIGNIGSSMTGSIENLAFSYYTLANALTSYEKTIGGHYFKALIGYEQEVNSYRGLYGSRMELITEAVPSINTALGTTTLSDAISHWATQGVFGRLNYNYKEKYLVEFSARYNGSSRFAKESRWGFFPSVSAGYNISKEKFWTSVESYVNMLKLRGSYGSLGNQNVANYLYLSSIPVSSNLPYLLGGERPIYAQVPGIISNDLTWETVTTLDFGVDAGFLNNRLGLVFDWYNRTTSDMFGPSESLPATLGTGAPYRNNAKLSTKGFEVSLDWKDKISSDLSYNVSISVGDSKSIILKYKNDSELIDTWYKGKDIGEIWGFGTDAIIQTVGEEMPDQSKYYKTWGPGDMKYKDIDGNEIINDGTRTQNDHGDLYVIGNSSPRYNIGLSAGLNWKGFDVNMFWQGIGKRDYSPHSGTNLFYGLVSGGSAGSESAIFKNSPALDYWRPADDASTLGPNTDAYFAKPYFTTELNKNRLVQSRYILNAAYMRLKNLQIGYTVPPKLSMKVHLYKARFYISGENLLTFTKLPKTMDPEIVIASDPGFGGTQNTGATYPISRSLSFGINLTF
ncbi:MAG: SusC/RagA family TonB-linked outer membrane protein [Bacteroidetes bacterium GWF2_42_66]|nr:MAG: SusC/RagA family TonB-linked outer membrane protein [Bacteroidetes bacterium GWE2_42_39]OFY46775.1 MAG: SusC/RagA family TonB-linked outer membrane protein [Bacteroidetes bacterium GWF2_42_66]HAZ04551.1 SusC/RagA family TonB-linked outer membrane protein [Marinilabiliales bacterium]HBL73816.1 SusC/RagA family TonB-linked outer membrane protein [Prolixibacteraceae bacterium]HCU63251.1 SusC/RagA family TonB-linked outer membrane protein [Prolixibacteraceae bacterium]